MSWRSVVGAVIASGAAIASAAVWTSSPNDSTGSSDQRQLQGQTLFASRGCAGCHQPEGAGPGPDLSDAAAWAGDRVPGMTAEAYIAESIRQPGAFMSPEFRPSDRLQRMPDLDVSEEEIDALVDFLLED